MSNFILEIYSEEIPAGQLQKTSTAFSEFIANSLMVQKHIDKTEDISVQFTCNRLVVSSNKIKNISASIKGPKTSAPEIAKSSFLKKYNISEAETEERDGYLYLNRPSSDESTAATLKDIIEKAINLAKSKWKNKMSWNKSGQEWVRPIRNILCVFNGKVVDFSYAGITSSNQSVYCKKNKMASCDIELKTISSREEYFSFMKKEGITLDFEERKDLIMKEVNKLTSERNLSFDPKSIKHVVSENAAITEKPQAIMSEMPKRFLEMPHEIAAATMMNDQKYIPLYKNLELQDKFIIIVESFKNNNNYIDNVKKGHDKVLNARLEDGYFFFAEDKKKQNNISEAEINKKLESVKEASGYSLQDKANDMYKIYLSIFGDKGIEPIDFKYLILDLTTEAVREFTDLQGVIGSHYASSIWKHDKKYLRSAMQSLYSEPQNLDEKSFIMVVSHHLLYIQDHIEKGNLPTSKGDPFALKRHAQFVVQAMKGQEPKLCLGINKKQKPISDAVNFIIERSCANLKKEMLSLSFNTEDEKNFALNQGLQVALKCIKSETITLFQLLKKKSILMQIMQTKSIMLVHKIIKRIEKITSSIEEVKSSAITDKIEKNCLSILRRKSENISSLKKLLEYSDKIKDHELESVKEQILTIEKSCENLSQYADEYLDTYRVIEKPNERLSGVKEVLNLLKNAINFQ